MSKHAFNHAIASRPQRASQVFFSGIPKRAQKHIVFTYTHPADAVARTREVSNMLTISPSKKDLAFVIYRSSNQPYTPSKPTKRATPHHPRAGNADKKYMRCRRSFWASERADRARKSRPLVALCITYHSLYIQYNIFFVEIKLYSS